ncbi:MAG: Amino acid permease-associated region [Thermocaproicibacter melissae]|jgi:amino acid transporter|uniref:APC family permease n=1 Tax=Thermocaproicibacter melissae TaxID=2966552 RepID=UPI003A102EEB
MNLKNIILGKPLKNSDISNEKLSKVWGLSVLASDAVSSVAYAGEEILLVLVPVMGLSAFHVAPLVTLPILLLLVVLIISYSQVIAAYPKGGGAYSVTKENLGKYPALVVATALITDYIMTVAVSISSATAAITSVFPQLINYKVLVALCFVLFITIGNLRGIRESAKLFGIPTYIFIFSMAILIIVGLTRVALHNIQPLTYAPNDPNVISQNFNSSVAGISIALLLHAFSSGCSALTGVEAVSNAVPSFKEPSQRNAKTVLYMLGGISIFLFGGSILLESALQVMPMKNVTVISQVASAVFNGTWFSFMYYVIQIFTALILILAANTAYNGLPILLYILAHDNYVPRQFAHRGTKLSFSNGILFIFVVASLLIIGFGADTHRMIPLYTIGVFISFTLCQFSMMRYWLRTKAKGWKYKIWINGLGTLMTLVDTFVIVYNKFLDGAWMVIAAMPVLMAFMIYVNRHYTYVGKQLELKQFGPYHSDTSVGDSPCIVLMQSINKSLLKSLNYAKTISDNTIVLHICRHPEHAAELKKQWEELNIPIPLEVVLTPYRDIMKPFDDYIWAKEAQLKHGQFISVIIVKFVTDHWYDNLLHSQNTYFFERMLSKHKNVTATIMPFHYNQNQEQLRLHSENPSSEKT